MIKLHWLFAIAAASLPQMASANVAGGGTGQGPDVTVLVCDAASGGGRAGALLRG